MARERMFIKGTPINNIRVLLAWIDEGQYVFMHDRPMHPAWLGSMPYNALRAMCQGGRYFSTSIRNPAYVPRPKPLDIEETEIPW